jgi:hypothetical protein
MGPTKSKGAAGTDPFAWQHKSRPPTNLNQPPFGAVFLTAGRSGYHKPPDPSVTQPFLRSKAVLRLPLLYQRFRRFFGSPFPTA